MSGQPAYVRRALARRRSRGRVVLFVLAALLSAATIWQEIGPHDEGLMLQAAARIADGQLPYRDFWWNYGPGQPLLLAPLDLVFGSSLVPWRVVRVLLDATVALLAFVLAQREVGVVTGWRRALPLLAWVAVAGAMAFPTGPGPNPAALALGLGALYAVGYPRLPHAVAGGSRDRSQDLDAPRRIVLAGVLAGLAAVFRLEIGAAAALGLLLLGAPRALPVAALTAVVGWVPFVLAAPAEVLDQTLGFLEIQHLQRLPFPLDPEGVTDPNKLLELWMPALLVVGTAIVALHALVRRPPLAALALFPLAAAGLAYLLGRTDEFHLVPLSVALAVLLAAAAAREPRGLPAVALTAILALVALHGLERKAGQLRHLPDLAPVPGPAGDGVRTSAAEARDLGAVLAAIGDRTIFVAPPRFDRVTVGDPLLYVLAGKANSTRYDVIQPGVVTTGEVQREMVADLERARPELLVRWLDPRTAPEPNGSGRERGARILDAYLARAYGRPRRLGVYEVRQRVGA